LSIGGREAAPELAGGKGVASRCAAPELLADQPALLNGILDSGGLDYLNLNCDGIQRLFDGEEQVAGHVNGRGFGFDLNEEDMVAVNDDISAFVDPA
jgi:hypothetical protein